MSLIEPLKDKTHVRSSKNVFNMVFLRTKPTSKAGKISLKGLLSRTTMKKKHLQNLISQIFINNIINDIMQIRTRFFFY
jgi:hypothetical protein